MIWVYIFWPVSVVVAFSIGVSYRFLLEKIRHLENVLVAINTHLKLKGQIPKPQESKTVIIDPLDIEQQVKMEQEEIFRSLNPEMYDEVQSMQE